MAFYIELDNGFTAEEKHKVTEDSQGRAGPVFRVEVGTLVHANGSYIFHGGQLSVSNGWTYYDGLYYFMTRFWTPDDFCTAINKLSVEDWPEFRKKRMQEFDQEKAKVVTVGATHATEMLQRVHDALTQVNMIVESTYLHDDFGQRIDGDSPASGADVVQELCELEPRLNAALRNLNHLLGYLDTKTH